MILLKQEFNLSQDEILIVYEEYGFLPMAFHVTSIYIPDINKIVYDIYVINNCGFWLVSRNEDMTNVYASIEEHYSFERKVIGSL